MADLAAIGKEWAGQKFNQVIEDAVSTMKGLAPVPTGAKRGKGSMATGKTKGTISVLSRSEHEAIIGPTTDYAKYAEHGRGAISKPYNMRFKGSDGKWHYTNSVGPMEGWHFVEQTAQIIQVKYGG